jgi:hypothetical protein
MKFDNARCLNGQTRATTRFANPATSGVRSGQMNSGQCLITSKSVRLRRFVMSSTVNQFCCNVGLAMCRRLATPSGSSQRRL